MLPTNQQYKVFLNDFFFLLLHATASYIYSTSIPHKQIFNPKLYFLFQSM